MPIIIPPQHIQTAITMTSSNIANGTAVTVLGWRATAPISVENLEDAGNSVFSNWGEYLMPIIDENVTLTEVRAVTETLSYTRSGQVQGDAVYTDPPPNCATLINHRTAVRGPRGRGRTFLYGALSENLVDGRGVMEQGLRTVIADAWEAFVDGVRLEPNFPMDLVILQGEGDGQQSAPIDPPPTVTSSSVSSTVASQRRRLRP